MKNTDLRLCVQEQRIANISYPASSAAVVFGVHLSAQSRLTGIDRKSNEIWLWV